MTTIWTDGTESEQRVDEQRVDDEGTHRIVVGVDGSVVAAHALELAHTEARMMGAELEVVWAWTAGHVPSEVVDDELWAVSHAAVWAAPAMGAPACVTATAVKGPAGPELVHASADAALLVVGARGRTDRALIHVGSVSLHVVAHASVPVLVVPGGSAEGAVALGGPIVVGVDGSEPARRALRWALSEARRRSVGVIVVNGWERPATTLVGPVPTSQHAFEAHEEASRRLLDEELPRVEELAAVVPREALPVCHRGGRAVLAACAATGASLVVVGRRGRSSTVPHLLGSVSHRVVTRSPVPVVVVR